MHNGAALYASNAGKAANADDAAKLDGLAPEAYIQPQDNMLDNWNFANPINEQGKKVYTGVVYGIDRWTGLVPNTTLTVGNGFVTIGGNIGTLIQRQELLYEHLAGKTITAGLLDAEGQTHIITGTVPIEKPDINIIIASKNMSGEKFFRFRFDGTRSDGYGFYLAIGCGTVTDWPVVSAKLELGPRFTGWPVWNYGLELARCQRYYFNTINKENYAIVSSAAYARTNNRLQCVINSPVSMRTRPVPKIIGEIWVRNYSAAIIKKYLKI